MVPMDRAWQDWVYEHAEMGRPALPSSPQLRKQLPRVRVPYAARKLHESRGHRGKRIPRFSLTEFLHSCRRSNGPAGSVFGKAGHTLSANGSPQPAARSRCFPATSPWFATFGATVIAPAPLWSFARSTSCLVSAFPLSLAVRAGRRCCRTERYDGKRNLYIQHAA
jgi:hypothetical protein